MEVDEKTDSREMLEMREWNVMKDMRKLERVKSMDEANKNVDKEDLAEGVGAGRTKKE